MDTPRPPYVIMPTPAVEVNEDRVLLEAVKAMDNEVALKSAKTLWIFLALLFVALGGLNWGWESVMGIGVAVLLHELGHVMAMRTLGYKNVRMLFIPLFGGLALGQSQFSDAGRNALVTLAGPVFGFLSTALIGVVAYYYDSPPWLVNFVWVALGLNAFNLLPIFPLDGGQVMNEIAFARLPVLERLFRLVAAAGLGYLAWLDRSWILGMVAFLNLMTIDAAYRRACVVREFWRELRGQSVELDEAMVGRLRKAVQSIHPKIKPEALEKDMARDVKALWQDIQKRYPSFWGSAGIVMAYLFSLVILMPILVALAIYLLGKPHF